MRSMSRYTGTWVFLFTTGLLIWGPNVGGAPALSAEKIIEAKAGNVWQPTLVSVVGGDTVQWKLGRATTECGSLTGQR